LKPSNRIGRAALLTAALLLSAAAQAGSVAAARGEAWVERGQQTLPLRVGAALEDADELVTGPGAEVLVRFEDEARMVVRPESRLELHQLLRKGEPERQQKITIVKGSLRYLSSARTDRRKVIFTSPHVTIGIRGTDIEIALDADGANSNPPGTYLKVNSGVAVLTGLDGTAVELSQGEVALGAEAELTPRGARSIRSPSAKKLDAPPADLFRSGFLDSLLR
jgi:hypothetical protein